MKTNTSSEAFLKSLDHMDIGGTVLYGHLEFQK